MARKTEKRSPQFLELTAEQLDYFARKDARILYGNRPPKVIQPDYARWGQVQPGMTRKEVVALLGEPMLKYRRVALIAAPYVLYGVLDLKGLDHPLTYDFMIRYDADDRVAGKYDPFGGVLSMDGTPSKPALILPMDRARLRHHPHVLDIRWQPCSGEYPIEYAVEIGLAQTPFDADFAAPEDFFDHLLYAGMYSTHCVYRFPGSQPGRVRVRASNARGDGEWSDYRYFTFALER